MGGSFSRYDYNDDKNELLYGKSEPPIYNLENIDIPVYIFAGKYDLFAVKKDVNKFVSKLTKSPNVWIKFYNAGHCSFLWGKKTFYYDDLFDIIIGI